MDAGDSGESLKRLSERDAAYAAGSVHGNGSIRVFLVGVAAIECHGKISV